MSCQPPQIPVPIIGCGNSGTAVDVTDDMIGISRTAKTFVPTNIAPFSSTTCTIVPTTYNAVVPLIITNIGNYIIPGTGSDPYGTTRDQNGLLKSTAVATIIGKLGICLNASNFEFTKDNIAACNVKDNIFITNVQLECAYYYALYKYAIKNLAAAITCPVTTPPARFGTNWPDSGVALRKYTDAAIVLNQMVNDVIYIMDQVAQKRTNIDSASMTTKLNGLDGDLQMSSMVLEKQRNALTSSGQNKMVLYKEMEAYSRQKAAYHNNLLALYSFLNITALGLLFYVYRST
jgi:hypothetical protein